MFVKVMVQNTTDKKLGTLGLMSNFSFYYAHHMTTIEGGMICTNNKEIYELSSRL